jgi:hypothetical protein
MIKVYVTPEEKRRVQQMAQMLGCSMSEVLHPSDPNRSRGPVSRLRRRVDLRMLTIQLRRLLEKMEGAGSEPLPDSRPPSADTPGIAFDEALVADIRDLIVAAQQALSVLPQEGAMGDLGRDGEGATDVPQPTNR